MCVLQASCDLTQIIQPNRVSFNVGNEHKIDPKHQSETIVTEKGIDTQLFYV